MIYTFTGHPAWDITYLTPSISFGLNRALESYERAGGKGVNVTRAVMAAGGESTAVLVQGGHRGEHLVRTLREEGMTVVPFAGIGETRCNISLIGGDNTSLEINGNGAAMDAVCVEEICRYIQNTLGAGDILCLCGSLPPFVGERVPLYPVLCDLAARRGARVVVDSGPAILESCLASASPPWLIKPNLDELTGLGGSVTDSSPDAVMHSIRERIDVQKTAVLCTLGKDGACFVSGKTSVFCPSVPVAVPKGEKGAGDTYLGTFLHGWQTLGMDVAEAMAMAAKAACVLIQNN